jgi:hypothetical protein
MKIKREIYIDPQNTFLKWYSLNIKPVHDEFNDLINQTQWMNSIKEEYIEKIKEYVKSNTDKAKILFDKDVEIYTHFISNNFVALENFIKCIDIMKFVCNIKNSFNTAISMILKEFNENPNLKWSFDTSKIQLFPSVVVNGNIKHNLLSHSEINIIMIKAISNIKFENKEIKNSLLKICNSKDYINLNDILLDYLIMTCEEKFINERLKILPQKLDKLQDHLHNINQKIDYISMKKYHAKNESAPMVFTKYINYKAQ